MAVRVLKVLTALALAGAGAVALGKSPGGDRTHWARAGEPLSLDCRSETPSAAISTHGNVSVSFGCRADGPTDETFRINYKNESGADLRLSVPLKELNGGQWRPQEILWSPDGQAFLINGSETAYSGVDFVLFRVEGDALVRKSITPAAQTDMLGRLARCWPYLREIVGDTPRFNMAAISWVGDSLDVFAEVPCTSSFENSMCSVYGYQMDARTGAIAKVLSASEVNNTWYPNMSWKMAASDLPSCDPHTGKVH